MSWPTPQDYNEAVQNPRLAFTDPDLRVGQPELNALQLPRPISGNFACVYKIQSGSQRWAARCFISRVTDLQCRYEAISEYLAKVNLPYTVPFSYASTGIKLQGQSYPLLKMQWVQGESLSTFVGRAVSYPDTLLSLAKVWSKMMADLKAVNIAHGDLQHGNILIVGDQLRLIDYDGMFVPALAGKQSNELGHRNYQLPSRSSWDYGSYLDNFSAWVIYVSLVALAVHPELWGA
jgi:aminoglycoside phosphotransferase (APT) family kinase protein